MSSVYSRRKFSCRRVRVRRRQPRCPVAGRSAVTPCRVKPPASRRWRSRLAARPPRSQSWH